MCIEFILHKFVVSLFVLFTFTCTYGLETNSWRHSFDQCLIANPSLGYCAGVGALNQLEIIDNQPVYDLVEGVTFMRDDQQPRTIYNFLERNPSDFSGVLGSVDHVVGQRTLRWDMGMIYPGLVMRITPSVNGMLEFVMDQYHEDIEFKNRYQEIGTGRLLARQFLVPFLLGLKFKVATLVPIFFGFLAILAKKILVVSKLALVISSAFALGSLIFGTNGPFGSFTPHRPIHQHQYAVYDHHIPGFNPLHHGYKSQEQTNILYKQLDQNENASTDQLKFEQKSYDTSGNIKGRNFAWNDAEKDIKT